MRSAPGRLDTLDWARANMLLAEMQAEGRALLADAGVPAEQVRYERMAEMRYVGQGHETGRRCRMSLGLAHGPVLQAAFEAEYVRLMAGRPAGAARTDHLAAGGRWPAPTLRLVVPAVAAAAQRRAKACGRPTSSS
ncbi:MAG: hypothetical protein U0Z44_00940 [Kouleothrix sp.]